MDNKNPDIPTLTTVIQQGDPGMQNHFDVTQLNDEQTKIPPAKENASSYENEDAVDIPSLQLNEEELVELPQQDFSQAMQQRIDEIEKQPEASKNDSIRQSIDEAIAEFIPQIEKRLKQTLYKKFGV